MKKILITYENYLPKLSGVPIVLKYIAEGLVNQGYDVTIITSSIDGTPDKEIINGVNIIRLNCRTTTLGYKGNKVEYLKYIKSKEWDLIILVCSQCWTTDWVLKELDKVQVPKIFYPHGFSGLSINIFSDFKKCNIKKLIGKIIAKLRWNIYYKRFYVYMKKFDHVVYLSNHDNAKKYGDEHGIENYSIIENAVNNIFFDQELNFDIVAQKYSLLGCKKYFICVSNYIEEKRQEFSLEAFYKCEITNNYQMVYIGNNIRGDKYYKKLKQLKLKYDSMYGKRNVIFLEQVDRNHIPTILKNSKMSLFSSINEQYPLVVIESMSCKIPFISTNVGNVENLPGGIVINDINDMSNKIRNLIIDNNFYNKLSEQGYNYVIKNCTISNSISKFDYIIKNTKR